MLGVSSCLQFLTRFCHYFFETFGLFDCQSCQDFSINAYVQQAERVDELSVFHSTHAHSGVEFLYPQSSKIAFFSPSITVPILFGALDSLACNSDGVFTPSEVSFRAFQDSLMACFRRCSAFDSRHFTLPFCFTSLTAWVGSSVARL